MFSRLRSLVTLCAMLAPASGWSQTAVEARFAEGEAPVIIAHRSADLGGHAENSLNWIEYAIAAGVDMVHVNPQLTADDDYILMHDNTLNRMTNVEEVFTDGVPGGPSRAQRNGQDYVRDYTTAQIASLSLTDGQTVTTLRKALELADGRILLMLGLKSYEVESLSAILSGHDTSNLLLMELYYPGTDQSKLRSLSEVTSIPVAAAFYRSRDILRDLNALAEQLGPNLALINIDSDDVTPELQKRTAELGIGIAISGWDGPEDSALRFSGDPTPWLSALAVGQAALTDLPEQVLILARSRN